MTNLRREVNIISINHPSILKFIGYSPVDEYSSNRSLGSIIQLERKSLSPESWNDTKKANRYLWNCVSDVILTLAQYNSS